MHLVPGLTEDVWLSAALGRTVYRFSPKSYLTKKRDRTKLLQLLSQKSVFAYAKVAPSDLTTIHFLESNGFRLVDTNVVLEKRMAQPVSGDTKARLARLEDQEHVRMIARTAFTLSRFHLDQRISQALANHVKEEWVDSYFSGQRGDAIIVKEVDGIVLAFLAMLVQEDLKTAVIDLVAVHSSHRGLGYGRDMIRFAEMRYSKLDRLQVGTQVANVPSVRFYETLGFRLTASTYVFHYHH